MCQEEEQLVPFLKSLVQLGQVSNPQPPGHKADALRSVIYKAKVICPLSIFQSWGIKSILSGAMDSDLLLDYLLVAA